MPPREPLQPDRETLQRFLNALFPYADEGSFISLRAFHDRQDGRPPLFTEAIAIGDTAALHKVCSRVFQAANASEPYVFCPPTCTFATATDAKDRNIANGLALSVECDQAADAAREKLTQILGRPTIVVASGGEWVDPATGEARPKLHLHWRLTEPTRDPDDHGKLREARALATRLVGGDATNIAIVHPIRWPGSWHRKGEPRLACIVEENDTEIELGDALERLREVAPAQPQQQRPGRIAEVLNFNERRLQADLLDITAALTVISNADLPWDDWNRIGMATWAASSGAAFAAFDAWSQKSAKYDAAATAARWQHYSTSPPDRIGAGTLFELARREMPGWRKPSGFNRDRARSDEPAAEQPRLANDVPPPNDDARHEAGPPGGGEDDERPVIRFVADRLPSVVDQAEDALIRSGLPIFDRGGALVRPVSTVVPASKGRTTIAVRFQEQTTDAIVDVLAQAASFERFDGRSEKWVKITPPAQVASILLSRAATRRLPRVAGVITTPTMRADGSILSAAGYDPATGLYLALDPAFRLPEIVDAPVREEGEMALAKLKDLLGGFPFVTEVDRAVALSGIMTAVLRGGMSVAPMHVIRAHTPGTGKSMLVDLAAVISTGRQCPVIAAGRTEEETEKRLGGLLRDGLSMVSIDNLNGELGGDALCQMTERPLVRIRILGKSETPEFECRSALFATGNNLTLVGDMVRRAVLCTLDAAVERPELREFGFDPIARVLDDRGAYVAAVLTIARAHRAAGRPGRPPPIGSYAEWSDTVRGALMWLGEADPVASMEEARAEDPELSAMREVLSQWEAHMAEGGMFTSRAIAEAACERTFDQNGFERPDFRDALLKVAGDGGAISTRRLGKWLSRVSGRVVGGRRLRMKTDNSHGSRFGLENTT